MQLLVVVQLQPVQLSQLLQNFTPAAWGKGGGGIERRERKIRRGGRGGAGGVRGGRGGAGGVRGGNEGMAREERREEEN